GASRNGKEAAPRRAATSIAGYAVENTFSRASMPAKAATAPTMQTMPLKAWRGLPLELDMIRLAPAADGCREWAPGLLSSVTRGSKGRGGVRSTWGQKMISPPLRGRG